MISDTLRQHHRQLYNIPPRRANNHQQPLSASSTLPPASDMLSQQLISFAGQTLTGGDNSLISQQQQIQLQQSQVTGEQHQVQQVGVQQPASITSFFQAGASAAPFQPQLDDKASLVKKKKPGGGGGRPNPLPWQLVGVYETLEAMDAVRCSKKVSKRKSDHLKAGVKMSYRCNGWKRYKCPYKMYAMCPSDTNQISLHEAGKHDHSVAYSSYSGKSPAGVGKKGRGGGVASATAHAGVTHPTSASLGSAALFSYSSYPTFVPGGSAPTMVSPQTMTMGLQQQQQQPSTSSALLQQQQPQQQQPSQHQRAVSGLEPDYQLSSLMATFLGGGVAQQEYQQPQPPQYSQQHIKTELGNKVTSPESADDVTTPPPPANSTHADEGGVHAFSLSDGHSVSHFVQIARSLDLTFNYQPRQSEYIISTAPNQEKQVVFEDLGHQVKVSIRSATTGEIRSEELWIKADYNQFFWAVRGKCALSLLK